MTPTAGYNRITRFLECAIMRVKERSFDQQHRKKE